MHFEDREFVLTRADVRAITAFASRDVTRTYINGVWIDPARRRLFATNGHVLAVAQCRGDGVGDEPPRLVPTGDMEAALKHTSSRAVLRIAPTEPAAGADRQLTAGRDGVLLTVDGTPHRAPFALPVVRCPDEQPPAIESVTPRLDAATRPRVACSTFSAQCLALAPLVAAAAGSDDRVEMWAAEEPLTPSVLICSGDTAQWTVVIMPMRDGRAAARVTADEAIAWAAQIVADETERDPYAIALAWRAALPTPHAELPAKPKRRSKKPRLRAV